MAIIRFTTTRKALQQDYGVLLTQISSLALLLGSDVSVSFPVPLNKYSEFIIQ